MTKVPYTKQIQTFANQIGILKQRGMVIANENDAKAWLRKVSYYRMIGNHILWYNVYDISELETWTSQT